jgi:hypothetical protein
MERTSLLTVADQFQLTGIGLVVMPDFSVPEGWANIEETVLVETPNGRLELLAQFQQTHFKILDVTAPLDRRWRVVLCFPTATKEQVSVGSVVYASLGTKNALLKMH